MTDAADPTLVAEVSSGACPTMSKLNFTIVCSPLSTTPNNSRQSLLYPPYNINGGAIIDHKAPRERRFVAVQK